MDTAIVPSDVDGLVAVLERGKAALAECRTNAERLYIRDQAKAAAEVLKRRDIQTAASLLVSEAERVVAKSNPPQQGRRNDLVRVFAGNGKVNFVPLADEVPKLREMRQAHSQSDADWESRKAQAIATQTPVTRAGLIRENTGKQPKPKTMPLLPSKLARPLPKGGKVEVRIMPDGGVSVERLGPNAWVVNITPNGEIQG